jgi:type IV pilus secretin PilQ/predicted competence protein
VKPQPQTVAKAEAPKAVVKPETPKAEAPAAEALKRVEPIAPEPKKEGAKPVVTAEPPAAVPLRVAQAPRAEAQAPSSPTGQRLISLDFKDADVINLLRILAAESGKNIVLGDDVKGKISISLRNVTWELALETILEVRGLQKLEKENVIRIVSTEQLAKDREAKAKVEEAKIRAEADIRAKIAEAELREQEVQQRKLAAEAAVAEAQARGPLREETIRLSYADPDETVKTLIGLLGIPPEGVKVEAVPLTGPPPIAEQPFAALYGPGAQPPPPRPVSPSAEVLAKGITIRAHKPTNSIFIRHYAADLERIKKLIKEQLDVPLPQVKIEARMESMVREALQEIGVQWGGAGVVTTDKATLVGSGFTQPPGPGTAAQGPGGPNPNLTLGSVLPVDPNTGLSTGGNVVNLPVSLGSPAGGITFGIIGSRVNINLAIQALETQGKTRNLASPKVVTVENNKATMALGEEIPYATISSAGTQIQFKEATRKLEVTPTVVKEGNINRIKMKVVVEDNVRGATVNLGGAGNPPAIDKRKVETEVLVKEGETLVIGGVGIRRTVESLAQVPLFGRIPLLGWLFKRKGASDRDEELVVFITPSVVKTDQPKPAQSQGDKPKGP